MSSQTFSIDCELSYEVSAPTEFIFQIHVLQSVDQDLLDESVQLQPAVKPNIYADPTLKPL